MNNITKSIRKSILHMVHYSQSSHVGTCLSCVEILYALYFSVMKIDPQTPLFHNRDKFILSKGHGSAALYATLAERGYFPKDYLNHFYVDGGILPGHVDMMAVPGLEVSAGSLGHGLSIGVGMAIANRQMHNPGRIFVLLGDGECNEGSVWEAVMLASQLKLTNMTAIVDYNQLQGFGRNSEILNQDNLRERWESFGWEAYQIDGHDVEAVTNLLNQAHQAPKVIVAQTIKGKGVSFMEDRLEWHYKSPNDEQFEQAVREVDGIL